MQKHNKSHNKYIRQMLFNTKRSWNDLVVVFPILFLFIIMGIIMPFVNASFSSSSVTQNINGLQTDLNAQVSSETSIGAFTILFSIGKMFFWTFGDINAIIDGIIFIPLRIMLALFLYRQVRSGAG